MAVIEDMLLAILSPGNLPRVRRRKVDNRQRAHKHQDHERAKAQSLSFWKKRSPGYKHRQTFVCCQMGKLRKEKEHGEERHRVWVIRATRQTDLLHGRELLSSHLAMAVHGRIDARTEPKAITAHAVDQVSCARKVRGHNITEKHDVTSTCNLGTCHTIQRRAA